MIGDSVFDDRVGASDRARMGGDGKGSGGFEGSTQTAWVYEMGVWCTGGVAGGCAYEGRR